MDKKFKKAELMYVIFCIIAGLLFTYILLDFFVIVKDYSGETPDELLSLETPVITSTPAQTIPPDEATSTPEIATLPPTATPEPTLNPKITLVKNVGEYHTDEVSITVNTYRMYNTNVHLADIKLTNLDHLRTAFAYNTYGRNVIAKTSKILSDVGGILGINGDYYGSREGGFVVRNGLGYRKNPASSSDRNTYYDLAIMADGSFNMFKEKETTYEDVVAMTPWQVFSFGPILVENGQIKVQKGEDVMRCLGSNPRTAIAYAGELHYMFVVSDGRVENNDGLTLAELAEFLKEMGALDAYNLDGGGSSTMVFKGEVVNIPINGRIVERSLSDIVYISP